MTGCFINSFMCHAVFLKISRMGIDATWLELLVTGQKVSRNELLEMLATLRTRQLYVNNNKYNLFLLQYDYAIMYNSKRKYLHIRWERKDVVRYLDDNFASC